MKLKLFLFVTAIFVTSCSIFSEKRSDLPNVLFIVIDTLGAKHLSVYDSSLNTSPALAKLAGQSLVFERAYSPAPWTKPAVASMFTSIYPRQHGTTKLNSKLADHHLTLAEILQNKGYQTDAVVSHTLLKKGTGYEQGFDSYILAKFEGNVHNAIVGESVSDQAIKNLNQYQSNNSKKPLFQFLHYFDPHFNYQHHKQYDRSSWYNGKLKAGMGFRELRKMIPEMTEEDRKYLVDLYHEEIEYTDAQIARVLDKYKELELLDNTIVIVTADHGEEFLEHGELGHTRTLFDELINVPLIIYWKKLEKPLRVKDPVSTLDILPTILKAVGFEAIADYIKGVPLIENYKFIETPLRHIFSEVDFKSSGIKAKKSGVVRDRYKFFQDHLNNSEALYDLSKDPKELNNIFKNEEDVINDLKPFLDEHIETTLSDAEGGLKHSEEELEQLKSLGYL